MGILDKIRFFLVVKPKIWKYQLLSNCKNIVGQPILYIPLLLRGKGKISFGKNFQNGVQLSSFYYSNYNCLIALNSDTEIIIGDNVVFSNGLSIDAVTKVTIGNNVMIGINCFIIDSDGHDLNPEKRRNGIAKAAEIIIKDNVAIYYNCFILKGVTIGENSVIGSGSIVTKDIPANVFAAGNPARVIRNL